MTLDEVIEFKETYLRSPVCNLSGYEKEADQISIEALKRERECRENLPHEDWLLLPGETRE